MALLRRCLCFFWVGFSRTRSDENSELRAHRTQRYEDVCPTYYHLTPDCNQGGTITVRVLKQPSQGTLEIARDRGFTNYAADNIRAKCNAQEVELTRVWYKSNADFKGRDQAQLEAFFSSWNLDKDDPPDYGEMRRCAMRAAAEVLAISKGAG